MRRHRVANFSKQYRFGDCYSFHIVCFCGKQFGGWIPKEVEEKFIEHIKEVEKK
jgi:hypothetical protein